MRVQLELAVEDLWAQFQMALKNYQVIQNVLMYLICLDYKHIRMFRLLLAFQTIFIRLIYIMNTLYCVKILPFKQHPTSL